MLLTEKWLPSTLFLQLFCVHGLFYPIQAINLSTLKALGRSDLFLRLEIIKRFLLVIALVITYRWGIAVMICGTIVVSVFGYYINTYYIGKFLQYSIWQQLKDVRQILLIAILMGVCVYPIKYLISENMLMLLVLQVISGAIIYFVLCRLFRAPALTEVMDSILAARPQRDQNQ